MKKQKQLQDIIKDKPIDEANLLKSSTFPGALNYTKITDYKQGKLLGQGAFAMVKEAVHI